MRRHKSGSNSKSGWLRQQTLSVLGLATVIAYPAVAQEAVQPETIVVTGTRLADPNASSSSPVAAVSEEEVRLTGTVVGVENILNELPQFTASDASSTTFTGDAQIISTADLRGLGAKRTLVLVNGTRWVPATADGVVDLNTVPTALVKRVDVVTGGASAVYGSDAIAGVVNFILKDDFEGLEARSAMNVTEKGDGLAWDFGVTTGVNFGNGLGNLVLDISYSKRDAVMGRDRDYAYDLLVDATCTPGSLDSRGVGSVSNGTGAVPCFTLSGSGTLPGGTINGNIIFDEDGNPITPRPPGLFDNYFPSNFIQLPIERWTGTSLAQYDVNDSIEAYARFVFTRSESARNQHATSVGDVFELNLDNPFVQPALGNLLEPLDEDNDGIVGVDFRRRFLEVGDRSVLLDQGAFQAKLGFRGELGAEWTYDAYYQYGRNDRDERFGNDIAYSRMQQALLATTDGAGGPACIDPSNNCVPANVFGAGNISAAAADFLRTISTRAVTVQERVGGAYVSGDTAGFLTLPAGPVGLVLGAEWRKTEASQLPDFVLQQETFSQQRQLPTSGGYDVWESYAEVQAPIFSDSPLGQSLSLKSAIRYSDYSLDGVGGIVTWNAGTIYEPIDGLRVRGEYQKAIRAPNVRELFQGTTALSVNYEDPCSDRSDPAARTPELTQVCLATGVPQAALYTNLQPQSAEVRALSGGNPDLKEESTNTYTFGASLTPSFVDDLTFSVDYYNIEIEDAISFFGGGAVNTALLCYDGFQDASSIYCQAIERSAITGELLNIRGDFANVSVFETSGVDFQMDWSRGAGFGIFDHGSVFDVRIRGTHVIDKAIQSEPAADFLECEGLFGSRCGEPTPEWKLNSSVFWNSGPLGVNLQWRWFSSVSWDGQYTFQNSRLGTTKSFTPSTLLGVEIGSRSYFDLTGTWEFNEHLDMVFGVENLLRQDPPITGSSRDENNNTWPGTYDPFGRKFFISLRMAL